MLQEMVFVFLQDRFFKKNAVENIFRVDGLFPQSYPGLSSFRTYFPDIALADLEIRMLPDQVKGVGIKIDPRIGL
jgi:hypothetical protein